MKTISIAVTALLLTACASPDAMSVATDEYTRLSSQVEKEIAATEKTGFLWRDTEKLVADARTAQSQGKQDDALTLLRKALRQTQLAQKQAQDNANAGPTF
jgi:hypothetical protein